MRKTCLLLNADGSPVSLIPLSTLDWKEAILHLILGKATALEWHEDSLVRSQNWSTQVPAVLMLKENMKKKNSIRFSKQNVFLRDNFQCVYCGIKLTRRSATLDHVLPQSLGGPTNWKNTVCSCSKCNSSKGNNKNIVPKMVPHKPNFYELMEKRRKLGFEIEHPSWAFYLGSETVSDD